MRQQEIKRNQKHEIEEIVFEIGLSRKTQRTTSCFSLASGENITEHRTFF